MEQNNNTLKSGVTLALDTVHNWANGFYKILPNFIAGIIFLLIASGVAFGLRVSISRYFIRKGRKDLGRIVADFSFWIILILGILIAMTIILPSLKPVDLLASLGVGSLAVGFAFKDILQNWMSGLLILLRLPFRRGDQVSVAGAEGTVQRIEPRATIIRTYDGCDIVVPNTTIYNSNIIIYTSQETRRIEIDFTVGYAYDIRKITDILKKSLVQIEEVIKDPPPQILCWDLGATSLGIKVRWWIKSEKSQEIISRARVIQAIKEGFDANDIDPTDPQLIYYQQAKPPPVNLNLTRGIQEKVKMAQNSPPEVNFSVNDPEAKREKMESKNQTLLPD